MIYLQEKSCGVGAGAADPNCMNSVYIAVVLLPHECELGRRDPCFTAPPGGILY